MQSCQSEKLRIKLRIVGVEIYLTMLLEADIIKMILIQIFIFILAATNTL